MYTETRSPYRSYKVYGPYTRKDGRQHVCLYLSGRKRRTVSYPKFLIEIRLGKHLKKNETVHHKDKNVMNNKFRNLVVLEKVIHCRQDATKLYRPIKLLCQVCKKYFVLSGKKLVAAAGKRAASIGPFCSKSCAGYATHYRGRYGRIKIKLIRTN